MHVVHAWARQSQAGVVAAHHTELLIQWQALDEGRQLLARRSGRQGFAYIQQKLAGVLLLSCRDIEAQAAVAQPQLADQGPEAGVHGAQNPPPAWCSGRVAGI